MPKWIINAAGIMIKLTEEIVRETPTAVILDIANSCTNNSASIEYSNRIEAIGYDMMCRMYYHLETLIKKKRLPAIQEAFWCDLLWRAFIYIWHIHTHTDKLCQQKDGIFHPKVEKFNEILYNINELIDRVNDQIAEQFWSTMNATCQLKSMTKEKVCIFLLEKRSYYNEAKINEIKKNGWTFIPIEWCTSLRKIEKHKGRKGKFPHQQQLQKAKTTQLKKVCIKSDKINDVKEMIQKALETKQSQAIAKPKIALSGSKRKLDDENDTNYNKKRKIDSS